MANIHMKRCSMSLIIREMQSKTTRYHFTHVRMANVNKSTNNNSGEDVEKRRSSCSVGGNADRCSHSEKQYEVSFKK